MAGTSKRGLSASKTRSSGMKGTGANQRKTAPTARRGRPGPKLPGEKSVKPTERTVAVKPSTERTVAAKPSKESPAARRPPRGPAVDRRIQFVGTDELKR